MKKVLYLLMCAFALNAFVACSDDDDDDDVVDYAKEIAATYTGTLNVTVGDEESQEIEDQKVEVKRTADNKASITLKGFTFMSIPFADKIKIDNIEVSKSGEEYLLKEINQTLDFSADDLGDVKVKLSGKVKNSVLTLAVEINVVNVEIKAVANFEGTIPSAQ